MASFLAFIAATLVLFACGFLSNMPAVQGYVWALLTGLLTFSCSRLWQKKPF